MWGNAPVVAARTERELMNGELSQRAPREVLRMLLPEHQIVTVLGDAGETTGQLRVVACTGADVEVQVQRGEFRDGPITVRVGGGGVAWDMEGLFIRTQGKNALLANLQLHGRVQQRGWVRVPFQGPIEIEDEEGNHAELDGIDISAGGLAARCDNPPPRNAMASFTITAAGAATSLTLSVQVVRARCLPDGRWRVAYEFDKIDPATHNRLVSLVARLTTRTK
jgi:hypothetical protein